MIYFACDDSVVRAKHVRAILSGGCVDASPFFLPTPQPPNPPTPQPPNARTHAIAIDRSHTTIQYSTKIKL